MYLKIGILAGMALTHGGGAMNMLSQSVFKYICGVDPTDLRPEIAEVGDCNIRAILQKVC